MALAIFLLGPRSIRSFSSDGSLGRLLSLDFGVDFCVMVVGRVTSCSPKQVVELLPARLLRTVLLQQQLLLAPDQLVFVFVLVLVFALVLVFVLVFVLVLVLESSWF